MLIDMDLKSFLTELASGSPAPGGGSVSALAGSLAGALVAMVARLTLRKKTDDKEELERVLGEATLLMESLNQHVDEDTRAFNRVMQAYRLPVQTEEEKQTRFAAIQEALQEAAAHPLRVAGECLRVLRLCLEVVESGNRNALSDAGVASLLAYGGVTGAMLNIAINLESITDPAFVQQMMVEKDRLMSESARLYANIRGLLQERLSYASSW